MHLLLKHPTYSHLYLKIATHHTHLLLSIFLFHCTWKENAFSSIQRYIPYLYSWSRLPKYMLHHSLHLLNDVMNISWVSVGHQDPCPTHIFTHIISFTLHLVSPILQISKLKFKCIFPKASKWRSQDLNPCMPESILNQAFPPASALAQASSFSLHSKSFPRLSVSLFSPYVIRPYGFLQRKNIKLSGVTTSLSNLPSPLSLLPLTI